MGKTILVVDDSRFIAEEIEMIVAESKYRVVGHAMSGEEALEAYKMLMPDVVTMDIVLPGMDGLEATEKLLAEYPSARVLIVSSLAYDETEEKAQELGAKGFLCKPFEIGELLAALDEAAK